jgi:hypothetical protein
MKTIRSEAIAELDSTWILTRSGIRFNYSTFTMGDIAISDIAHALSNLCRFTGHTTDFYSVAEHSVRCSYVVAPEYAMAALLHDAAEAYIGDINKPLRMWLHSFDLSNLEITIMEAVCERYNVKCDEDSVYAVAAADEAMLNIELADLMYLSGACLAGETEHLGRYRLPFDGTVDLEIQPLSSTDAESVFLQRFFELEAGEKN